jgi:hypothetical protein
MHAKRRECSYYVLIVGFVRLLSSTKKRLSLTMKICLRRRMLLELIDVNSSKKL